MLKKSSVFLVVLLCFSVALAQNAKVFDKAPKPKFESSLYKGGPSNFEKTQGAAVLIGKMWNGYTTQASYTNQIYTDPYSGLIAVIHRTDRTGAGSGRIVYQGSDDGGANWTPQSAPMNKAPWNAGRHPNIVLSNPTASTTAGDQAVVGGWAELSSSWYWYQFASDDPFGANAAVQYIDSTFYPGDEMFTNTKGHIFAVLPCIDYVVSGSDTINNFLYVSTDKGATWSRTPISKTSDFNADTWNGTKGFINKNGIGYIMVEGQKPGQAFYTFGYKKTTNDGATWDANWTWVNPYTVPGLSGVVHALNYEVDAIVDGAGNLHFVGTFVDTMSSSMTANTGVYHLYMTPTGWQGKLISLVNRTSLALPGGLSTLNECEFATDWDGKYIVIKWADAASPTDTTYDLYTRGTVAGSGVYTAVKNETNTPALNEKYSQMSPWGFLKAPNLLRVDMMYTIFGDNDTNDLGESALYYVSGVEYSIPVGVDETIVANKFELEQNYPNPFNPSTTIRYTVGKSGLVTLKVYDILGKEVATLVNEVKQAGTHTVDFVGMNLPSGVYTYKLTAGDFTSAKKMMLVK